jgi:hypothetical protein
MKLGLRIGYSGAELRLPVENMLLAERLGLAKREGEEAIELMASLAAAGL